MRSTRVGIFAFLLLISCLAQALHAGADLRLLESGTKATIGPDELTITCPVLSAASAVLSGSLLIELLDPENKVIAVNEQSFRAKPGENAIAVKLPRPRSPRKGKEDPLLWSRVRYRLNTSGSPTAPRTGLFALAALVRDLFEIQAVHAPTVAEGREFQVRIHAANPVTRRPVAGVRLNGGFELDSGLEKPAQQIRSMTNARGDAVLVFRVPANQDEIDGEVTIEAHKAGVTQESSFYVDLDRTLKFIVNTDKRLYQPGQILHARVLIMREKGRALANLPVKFSLDDPEGELILRGSGTTNRFGIANIEWNLPENLRLGSYRLSVEYEGDVDFNHDSTVVPIRISRYDLPAFKVSAKTDRTYYLPGQDAELEICADYLFGKPVNRGSVRVVREAERQWDFKEQKWSTTEAETYETELDKQGRAKVHLDLSALHGRFQNEQYARYSDFQYAAFVTDASTGRTEQRRFRVRLTHKAIHIYVLREEVSNGLLSFYVITSYADGTPARCRLRINQTDGQSEDETAGAAREQFLRSTSTNRYGVSKVSDVPVRLQPANGLTLTVSAQDSAGVQAEHTEDVWTEQPAYQVRTDKTLYADNDPIMVSIRSREASDNQVVVAVIRDSAILRSQAVRLRNHRAFVVFPYEPGFRGQLAIAAYSQNDPDEEHSRSRAVLYPEPSDLHVKLRTTQGSYKPGEQASASIRVTSEKGNGQESALGIVVVDKAVDERARTDEEFDGAALGFWNWGWVREPMQVGGVAFDNLNKLNMSEALPDGLDLVAEAMLNAQEDYWRAEFEGGDYASETRRLFEKQMLLQLSPVAKLLTNADQSGRAFPVTSQELTRLLSSEGLDRERLLDPWGTPYEFRFGVAYRYRTIEALSAGPDKAFDTADDIAVSRYQWEYFSPLGKAIDRAVKEMHARSGGYLREYESLRKELKAAGVDLAAVRDPWGESYRFEFNVNASVFRITAYTKAPSHGSSGAADEFVVWNSNIDYFAEARHRIDDALEEYAQKSGGYVQSENELKAALSGAGIEFDALRDPWDRSYYATFPTSSVFADRVVIYYQPQNPAQANTPITQKLQWVSIWSSGPDGVQGTKDDFRVASYAHVISTQGGRDATPVASPPLSLMRGTGAITGTVADPTGAVIPGAQASAIATDGVTKYAATSDERGVYLIRNLPGGRYKLEVISAGFRTTTVLNVPVRSESSTTVNVRLEVGTIMQAVEVSASREFALATTTAGVVISRRSSLPGNAQVLLQEFTPRLRQFFPETLYWRPSLITDRNGNAKLDFKLADNITTWKLAVIASSEKGEVGYSETDITAFQPFFVEHDPPQVLTVGDRIDLPVVIRNYERQRQQVRVTMKPEQWFEAGGAGERTANVEPGEPAKVIFPFTAVARVKEGRQRVTAANRTTGDAVEKKVRVHPDGREITRSASRVIAESGSLEIEIPAEAVAGSVSGEVRIYPNLLAHIIESIEGSLQRPYGCGEQTISSTYPSLLLAAYYKAHPASRATLKQTVERYVTLGYQRLMKYRDPSGGFTYWGRGEPDAALTAYALRFLKDASAVISVDNDLTDEARNWLIKHQQTDGSWRASYGKSHAATAYVALALAASLRDADAKRSSEVRVSLDKANAFLSASNNRAQDPYITAVQALADWHAGNHGRAHESVLRLLSSVHHEGDRAYWTIETNTPFYGWGTAGRIETTALALQALATVQTLPARERDVRAAIDDGLRFLLAQKDRYGVWYSGQATVNVLQAMLELLGSENPQNSLSSKATIFVNGVRASELDVPPSTEACAPLTVDISGLLKPGRNKVEVRRAAGAARATFSIFSEYYVPWRPVQSDSPEAIEAGDSRALRLGVDFDRTNTEAGSLVKCVVRAERIGHRGYGMLLAEVGLPPGADVDRASLEQAVKESGLGLMRYEVLPDRVVLYLWPSAGGTRIAFGFRPRFGLNAQTAASMLYDYYNPESQVTLAPVRFTVSGAQR